MYTMRSIVFLLLVLSNCALASQVLVVVDGKAITSVDFDKRVEALRIANPSLEITPSLSNVILNNLVSEELFRNEAKRLKFSVSEEEVKSNFKTMQLDYGLSDELLNKLVKNNSFYQQVESQTLWHKLIGAVLYNKVKVSDAEIRDEQMVWKAVIREVTFKQVILGEGAGEKLVALREESADCTKLDAASMSLGFYKPYTTKIAYADLSSQLQEIIRDLPENQLSQSFLINGQNIALMVCNKEVLNNPKDINKIRQELSNRKINAEAQKYLAELKKRVYIEYHYNTKN